MDSNKSNDFESFTYNFFQTDEFLLNDQDLNYFSEADALQSNCSYYYANEIKEFLDFKNFNALHINIRSITKNFENFYLNMKESINIFSLICMSETWCNSENANSNSNICLPGYNIIFLDRKNKKRGGGLLIYIKECLRCITRHDMSISDDDKEILTVEIQTKKNNKNLIISCCYRPPSGQIENFNLFLNDILKKSIHENKLYYLIGDINLDCFQYHTNCGIKIFYNELFEHGAFPLINKPTRITQTSATLIDNIITTDIFNKSLKKGIIKSDVSDHFPIFFSININTIIISQQEQTVKKRYFNTANLRSFKEQLSLLHWNQINALADANLVYDTFFKTFYEIYDANFPKNIVHKI